MFQFKNDIDFLFEIGTLRRIARTWNQFFGTEVANDTEHTFRVAWIALILAKHENVENTGHILELALIHDIGEIRTGDVNYLSRQYTSSDEEQAVHDTFEGVSIGGHCLDLWKEMEERETRESRVVKDADSLDVDLEIVEKMYEGFEIGKMLKAHQIENVRQKLFTETAKQIQREIYESNPHDWHFLSEKNRFRGGDMRIKS